MPIDADDWMGLEYSNSSGRMAKRIIDRTPELIEGRDETEVFVRLAHALDEAIAAMSKGEI